jgi:hypothetical protein
MHNTLSFENFEMKKGLRLRIGTALSAGFFSKKNSFFTAASLLFHIIKCLKSL